jgi:hypothetical protein
VGRVAQPTPSDFEWCPAGGTSYREAKGGTIPFHSAYAAGGRIFIVTTSRRFITSSE